MDDKLVIAKFFVQSLKLKPKSNFENAKTFNDLNPYVIFCLPINV